MIKLIASDIDGTLIPYGKKELPPELFPLICRLRDKGILFCPASGRQYYSLRWLFAPAADDMCFLCENGGAVFGPGGEEDAPVLSKTPMPREVMLELSRDIAAVPGCQAVISGVRTAYAYGDDTFPLVRSLEKTVKSRIRPVETPEEIAEAPVKISAYCPKGPREPMELLAPRWGKWNMAVAGPVWLDFGAADKGTGIRGLCQALNIALDEVAAFGDNWNDTAMLETVGHPWLMDTAEPALRERFPRQCSSVLEKLRELLA